MTRCKCCIWIETKMNNWIHESSNHKVEIAQIPAKWRGREKKNPHEPKFRAGKVRENRIYYHNVWMPNGKPTTVDWTCQYIFRFAFDVIFIWMSARASRNSISKCRLWTWKCHVMTMKTTTKLVRVTSKRHRDQNDNGVRVWESEGRQSERMYRLCRLEEKGIINNQNNWI